MVAPTPPSFAIPEPPPRFGDGVVELRSISEWDIPEVLIAHQDDPRLHAALGLRRPPSGAELGREVELADHRRLTGAGLALTIVEPGSDDCIGRIDLRVIAGAPAPAGEVAIWVAPRRREQGIGRRALRLAADWLLGPAGLHRLAIEVPPDGAALRAAATAAGFSAGGGGELAPHPRRLELQRRDDRSRRG